MTKPEKTFRIGRCSASVFVNAGKQASFRSVSLQRRYREGEKWKTSTSFTLADLPDAVAVLQLALHHLAAMEFSAGK
jgi:hypothetical protein